MLAHAFSRFPKLSVNRLGIVVQRLAEKMAFIPYRDSKVTIIILLGNSR